MDRVRAVLDRLADQTEPPCRLDTYHAAYTQAIDRISRIAYPDHDARLGRPTPKETT